MKKVKSSQEAIIVLNWVKTVFTVSIVMENIDIFAEFPCTRIPFPASFTFSFKLALQPCIERGAKI